MSLAGQWTALDPKLPASWAQAGLRLELADRATAERAAALLGPAQPYRLETNVLRFSVARDGSAQSPEQVASLLRRLDQNGIRGELTLAGTTRAVLVNVGRAGGRLQARVSVRQTEWGIKPYRGLRGALKVRDEVEIVLDIRG